MPYTKKAHNFLAGCAKNPAKMHKKCPPKATAAKLASHGVKKSPRGQRR